ncbi:unnamed protein product [Sphagnum troendelagicum]
MPLSFWKLPWKCHCLLSQALPSAGAVAGHGKGAPLPDTSVGSTSSWPGMPDSNLQAVEQLQKLKVAQQLHLVLFDVGPQGDLPLVVSPHVCPLKDFLSSSKAKI